MIPPRATNPSCYHGRRLENLVGRDGPIMLDVWKNGEFIDEFQSRPETPYGRHHVEVQARDECCDHRCCNELKWNLGNLSCAVGTVEAVTK